MEIMRKPIEDMTSDEISKEILEILRNFENAINKLSDSPMARMIPGMGVLGTNGRR